MGSRLKWSNVRPATSIPRENRFNRRRCVRSRAPTSARLRIASISSPKRFIRSVWVRYEKSRGEGGSEWPSTKGMGSVVDGMRQDIGTSGKFHTSAVEAMGKWGFGRNGQRFGRIAAPWGVVCMRWNPMSVMVPAPGEAFRGSRQAHSIPQPEGHNSTTAPSNARASSALQTPQNSSRRLPMG